jgi:hypothetical protein
MAKDLPIYKVTIDPQYAEDGEDLGIEQIAFTNMPAIRVKGLAFNSEVKVMKYADDLKYRIVAPAMIPMQIYRCDEDGFEYEVEFSVAEIEAIHGKFMQDMRNKDLFNLEHDQSQTVPAYILESWIVDNPKQDKAYSTYGIEVPTGTLMVTAQVTDTDYYNKLVENDQVGFSIEGFLGLKLKEQLKLNSMNKLPDGEHLIEGKIYVVKGGEVIEIKDVPVEDVAATEEVEMAETVVEETEVETETPAEEEMAVDPSADAEAILAIVNPVIEEQVNQLVAMIADLKNQFEEALVAETTTEETMSENVALSVHEKFKAYNKLNN